MFYDKKKVITMYGIRFLYCNCKHDFSVYILILWQKYTVKLVWKILDFKMCTFDCRYTVVSTGKHLKHIFTANNLPWGKICDKKRVCIDVKQLAYYSNWHESLFYLFNFNFLLIWTWRNELRVLSWTVSSHWNNLIFVITYVLNISIKTDKISVITSIVAIFCAIEVEKK